MRFNNRNKIIVAIVMLISSLYVLKLFYIQVINKQYQFSARNNALRYDVLQPVRGLIYDRDNYLIVANKPIYDLMIIPREISNFDTINFCNLINISIQKFQEKVQEASNYSKFKESVFLRQIEPETAAEIQENLYRYRGFFLRTMTMRDYKYSSGSHLIGYMGEVDNKKILEDQYYIKGDIAGINGIEAAYEKELRGEKGMAITLVDVHNRNQGRFSEGRFDSLPSRGANLISTINIDLQDYAEKLMLNKAGSIVILEPETGEILTLVSAPSYNLNQLNGRQRSINFNNIILNKNNPIFNRALLAEYPPGSVFKIINSLIALEENIISEKKTYKCLGGYEYEIGKEISCHKHKLKLNLEEGIAVSCNTYFCNIFSEYFDNFNTTDIGYKIWRNHVKSFGIGEWMNNDFISGRKGFLPTVGYYNKYYGEGKWNSSTIISMAIGQGELLLTPIQMANFTAIIANNGYYYTPHIIKKIEGVKNIDTSFTKKRYCSISPKHFSIIKKGMSMAINSKDGTAYNSIIKDIDFCGKTGTAQNNHGEDHSIFIAFAPVEDPKIALAVYVENGGWGSTWAAPIGSLLIEKYLKNKISNKHLEKFILTETLIEN